MVEGVVLIGGVLFTRGNLVIIVYTLCMCRSVVCLLNIIQNSAYVMGVCVFCLSAQPVVM